MEEASPLHASFSYHVNERAVPARDDRELRVLGLVERIERVAREPAAGVLVEVVARVGRRVHLRQHRRTHLDAGRAHTGSRQLALQMFRHCL